MEESLEHTNDMKSNEKKPTFLVFLVVLTGINLAFSFYDSISSLISGPKTEEQMEASKAAIYDSMAELEGQEGMESLTEMTEKAIRYNEYINYEAFTLNYSISLLVAIVGLVAVLLMIQLKKIGFHIYVAYSLLPTVSMYLLVPSELISTFTVLVPILFSALFCVLYGLNLKHME
jgi:hypothetical protein